MKYNLKKYSFPNRIIQKAYHGILKRHWFYITSPFRVLPDFFVIGVVRSGTTSLYHYLGQHNQIARASYDELGYFDDNFHLGENWYRSLFPTIFTKKKIETKYGKFLTYDVTPFYIYNPLVIKRMHTLFPNAKIIANLRNPVDRAYSNYHIMLKNGSEAIPFEKVIESEIQEIEKKSAFLDDESFLVDDFYEILLARGFYADQLEKWFHVFPKEQLLITSSEELSNKTEITLDNIFKFLDVSGQKIHDLSRKNKRIYPKMNSETRRKLADYYRPHNEKLFRLIGKRFEWD